MEKLFRTVVFTALLVTSHVHVTLAEQDSDWKWDAVKCAGAAAGGGALVSALGPVAAGAAGFTKGLSSPPAPSSFLL